MRLWTDGALAACLLSVASVVHAGPVRPLAKSQPLPAPPTVPRVHLEAARDHILVALDVLLGRGDWASGDIDAFVAFGAPGLPRAVDARLYAAVDGEEDSAASEPIVVERAPRRPTGARLLLGVSSMAGTVLHIREAAFRRATGATGVARVRVRTLLDLPVVDAQGGREVVIRLGAFQGEPYALDALDLVSLEPPGWIRRADAHLCGPVADPYPLAIRTTPPTPRPPGPWPTAPVLSVRHATDDLCVRFWTTPNDAR